MLDRLQKNIRASSGSFGIVWLYALAFFLAWLLYPVTSRESDGREEIVFWMKLDPMLYDPIKPALEEFERRNPQYKIHLGNSTTRNEDGDPTRFLLGVAGGVPPDLLFFDRFAIVEWASRGAFENLNPLIERDQADPLAIIPSDYFPTAWEETQWQGGTYAIPTEINTRALYYLEAQLVRAGLVFKGNDPEVTAGKARTGEARPPRTWEEVCHKLAHLTGDVSADGWVSDLAFLKRPAVNEERQSGDAVKLAALGIRAGDVVVLVRDKKIFRGRISKVDAVGFAIDFQRDQGLGLTQIGSEFRNDCEIKVYSQDDYLARLSRFDPVTGRLQQAAFLPLYGNSWLYLFGWQNGAEFMNEAGSRVLLDSPGVIGALQWLQDVYDAQGGYQVANVFQNASSLGGLDPFLGGRIVMLISVSNYVNTGILAFDPRLDFRVAPAPLPEARLKAGIKPLSWAGGFAYGIPSTAKNKQGAWELLKWLSSYEANRMLVQAQTAVMRAKGLAFLPAIDANRQNQLKIDAEFLQDNPVFTPQVRKAAAEFRDLVPQSRYRPVTPVGQRLWAEHSRATEASLNHIKNPYEALTYGTRQTQNALDATLNPPVGPKVDWPMLLWLYCLLIVGGTALALVYLYLQGRLRTVGGKSWHEGYLAASPWLLGFVVFGAGPILFSVVISFCSYDVLNPAIFTGWRNYIELAGTHHDVLLGHTVANDPLFWKSLWNTLFMVLTVPLSIVVGLAIALLLNAPVKGIPFYRTFFYLPAIVPAVAGFLLWVWILDPNSGLMNLVLRSLGVMRPPDWLQDATWSKPSLVVLSLWGVGGSMVIWIAGLRDVPATLYEAAEIDGASFWQKFVHITLPMLSPYILFNTIMGLIAAFQVFDAAYIMTDGGPADSTLFYVYKLFNEAFRYLSMGKASAMAWLLFIVILGITFVQLWLSKKWVHYRG